MLFESNWIEGLHLLYNDCPMQLQRGVDADSTELLIYFIQCLNASSSVDFVTSITASCRSCLNTSTKYETSTCLQLYLHSQQFSSIPYHLRKYFNSCETSCSMCHHQASEKESLEVVMDFFIIQVRR